MDAAWIACQGLSAEYPSGDLICSHILANTWIMLTKSTESRDQLRDRLRAVTDTQSVPVARDCSVLLDVSTFAIDDDTFEQDNGFHSIEVDYLEEGSPEALRQELLSDAEDYAASSRTGWFYATLDEGDGIDSHAVP